MLALPSKWDTDLLNMYLGIVSLSFEVYDSLKCLGPLGSGRSGKNLPDTSVDKAKTYVEKAREQKIHINYLLNGLTGKSLKQLIDEGLDDQLDAVMSLKPDSVTMSMKSLMEYFYQKYPDTSINISTIAAINTPKCLSQYDGLPIRKVVVPHQSNRDFKLLEKLAYSASEKGIIIEIIVNESCLHNCSVRQEHYLATSEPAAFSRECTLQRACNLKKLIYPYMLLMSDWIRPEDLHMYEKIGIDQFKLSCRTMPFEWFYDVVLAYVNREYDGNLIRLLGITPPGLEINQMS